MQTRLLTANNKTQLIKHAATCLLQRLLTSTLRIAVLWKHRDNSDLFGGVGVNSHQPQRPRTVLRYVGVTLTTARTCHVSCVESRCRPERRAELKTASLQEKLKIQKVN